MTDKKNHSPLSPSDSNKWRNCPGDKKKLPKPIIYGKGGIGKTSFAKTMPSPAIIQSWLEPTTEEKKK